MMVSTDGLLGLLDLIEGFKDFFLKMGFVVVRVVFSGLMCGGFLLGLLNWLLFGMYLPTVICSFMSGCLLLLRPFIYSLIFLPLNRFEIGFHRLLVLDMRPQLHKLLTTQQFLEHLTYITLKILSSRL